MRIILADFSTDDETAGPFAKYTKLQVKFIYLSVEISRIRDISRLIIKDFIFKREREK